MIIQYPDPRLFEVCTEVIDFEAGRRVAIDLFDALEESKRPGVGLAASQIGSNLRVFVMNNIILKIPGSPIFINPEITHRSSQTTTINEGCLSWEGGVPSTPVKRHSKVTIKAFDGSGKPFKMKLEGLAARCAQHEFYHLNGINVADKSLGITPEERLLRAIFNE